MAVTAEAEAEAEMGLERRAYARVGLLGNRSDVYVGRALSFTNADFSATVRLRPSPELLIQPHPHHDLVAFPSLPQLASGPCLAIQIFMCFFHLVSICDSQRWFVLSYQPGQWFPVAQVVELCTNHIQSVSNDQTHEIVVFLHQSDGLLKHMDTFNNVVSLKSRRGRFLHLSQMENLIANQILRGPRGRGKRVGDRLGWWACRGDWARNGRAELLKGEVGRPGSCVEKYCLLTFTVTLARAY